MSDISPDKELKLPTEIWLKIYSYTCLQDTYKPRIIQVVEEKIGEEAE